MGVQVILTSGPSTFFLCGLRRYIVWAYRVVPVGAKVITQVQGPEGFHVRICR